MRHGAHLLVLVATLLGVACTAAPAAPTAAPAPPTAAPKPAATSAPAAAATAAPTRAPAVAPPTTPTTGAAAKPSGATATPAASSAKPNLKGQTIRLIYNGSPDVKTTVLTHAAQLMRDWGADVQTNFGGTAQVVLGAMLNGQADVLEFSAQGTLSGVNSGMNLVAFALDEPRMDYVMIGSPKIKTTKDLKDAKIGVLDTTGINGVQAIMALEDGGLTKKDATIIATGGQGERVAALVSGRIDATMVGFANFLKLQPQGYNMVYSYTKQQPKLFDGLLWATPEWLAKNPDTAVAWNQALLESFRWFNDPKNKDAWIKETTDLVKGTDPTIASQMYDIYKQNSMYPVNAIMNVDDLTFNQKVFVDQGSLPKELPISQWADVKYAQQALQKEGTAPEASS